MRSVVEQLLAPDRLERQGLHNGGFYHRYVRPHLDGHADHKQGEEHQDGIPEPGCFASRQSGRDFARLLVEQDRNLGVSDQQNHQQQKQQTGFPLLVGGPVGLSETNGPP